MISDTNQRLITAIDLFALPSDGNRYELVKGVVNMMSPAGGEHGQVAARILVRLATHVERRDLGRVYAAETGFLIETSPDTVRAPDAAFISHQRLSGMGPTRSFLPLAPDLVVEVVSPNDRYSEVEAKAADWLQAGTELVLVADPENKTLKAYARDGKTRTYTTGETFSSEAVCGDWHLPVDDVFGVLD